ncbi:MAG: Nif3-like dinuclear metal center hexameric protein [Pseudomonadota bacterium]
MAQLKEITSYTNKFLRISEFSDYCPNGLQLEGKSEVQNIALGVTASLAFIEQAIAWGADALIVHHGYFWKGERPEVVGMKKQRLAALLKADVSLLAYHLPLDAHPEVGNNTQLARRLGIMDLGPLQRGKHISIGNVGSLAQPTPFNDFVQTCEQSLARTSTFIDSGPDQVQRIALCTGGAQNMIDDAVAREADVFLTGEISEQTTHIARECGLNFISAGHHATERYGVQALGKHLAEKFNLKQDFIDIDNPA